MNNNNLWGPRAWEKFHITALDYPQDPCHLTRKEFYDFYTSYFFNYIHCETCSKEYRRIINQYPPDLSSPRSLFRWTVMVHNMVNSKVGKPQVTLVKAWNLWKQIYQRDNTHSMHGMSCGDQIIAYSF